MKIIKQIYIISVITAPLIFIAYYNFEKVCAPRAFIFEIVTGAISLCIFLLATRFKKIYLYGLTALIPLYIIICSPIIMVNRLGAEKWLNERLLAYTTFEVFAILQLILISISIGILMNKK